MATFDLGRVTPLYKGDYSASTSYELNDVVLYNGNLYWHVQATATVGILPTDTTVWKLAFSDEGVRAEIRGYADDAQVSKTAAATSASQASASASNASASASQAALSAQSASTKASEASTSAQTASTKASEASTSAQSAATSAQTATDKATLASQKAAAASESASLATTKASAAATSETNAAASAQTASAKASEAAASAQSAQEYDESAQQSAVNAQTAQAAAETAQTGAETAQGLAEDARDEAQEIVDGISAKAEQIDALDTRVTAVEDSIGDLSQLTTTAKNNLVSAINETSGHLEELVPVLKSTIDDVVTVLGGEEVTNSEQIFIPNTTPVTNGYYIDSNGEVTVDEQLNWNVTDLIPVEPNGTITYKNFYLTLSSAYSAFYDASNNFVSAFKPTTGGADSTITVPSTANYVRFSLKNTDVTRFTATLSWAETSIGLNDGYLTRGNTVKEDLTLLDTALYSTASEVSALQYGFAAKYQYFKHDNILDDTFYSISSNEVVTNINSGYRSYKPIALKAGTYTYSRLATGYTIFAYADGTLHKLNEFGTVVADGTVTIPQDFTLYATTVKNHEYTASMFVNDNSVPSNYVEGAYENSWSDVDYLLESDPTTLYQNNTVKTIAHRGDFIIAPQCTRASYIIARKRGITIAENDIQVTVDGQYVMYHGSTLGVLGDLVDLNGYLAYTDGTNFYFYDANNSVLYNEDYTVSSASVSSLTRCNGTNYTLANMQFARLRKISFGAYKGSRFISQQIMTFAEWILLCKQLGMDAYIDRKFAYDNTVIDNLLNIVQNYGMKDNVVWIGLSHAQAVYLRAKDSNAKLAKICASLDTTLLSEWSDLLSSGRGVEIVYDGKTITEVEVHTTLQSGYPVQIYYVDVTNLTESQVLTAIQTFVSWGANVLSLDHYRTCDAFKYILDEF